MGQSRRNIIILLYSWDACWMLDDEVILFAFFFASDAQQENFFRHVLGGRRRDVLIPNALSVTIIFSS